MASVKLAYGSATELTITLASLATDATQLIGRASTVVDNTSNLYLDYLLSGKITVGTSPTTGKEIRVYIYASMNDTPTYPDSITGTDADKTMTSSGVLDAGLVFVQTIATESTSNREYSIRPVSVAALFGGTLPKKWGVFVTHNTAVALNATGSNHAIYATGVYETIA